MIALAVAYGWFMALGIALVGAGLASAGLLARIPSTPPRSAAWRVGEGLTAAPRAALLALGAWGMLRAAAALRGWGPAETWLGVSAAGPRAAGPYVGTALASFAGATSVAVIGLIAFGPGAAARGSPRLSPFAVKSGAAAALLSALALLLPLGAPSRAAFVAIPPDVATLLPLLALIASGYVFRRERPAPTPNEAPAPAAPAAHQLGYSEALSLARELKVLDERSRAIALSPAPSPPGRAAEEPSSNVWRGLTVNGCALPDSLRRFWDEPDSRVLVPDLPATSAHWLIEAIAAGGVLRGERTLALVEEPRASAERVRAVLAGCGIARPNVVVAELSGLERARREQACPSIVFVSLAELCALPARLLVDPVLQPLAASERTCVWLEEMSRLSAPDACHLGYALRELAGIRAAEGGVGGVWVFGEGTRALRDWLTLTLGEEVSVANTGWPAAEGASQLWLGSPLRPARPADAPKQANDLLTRAPRGSAAVEDRIGWFAGRDRPGATTRNASLCWLWAAPSDLVAAARQNAARPAHEPSALVVSTLPGVVNNVLLDPEVAWAQDPPQRRPPALGASSLIALAHLEALLGAGRLPQQALAWIYGAELVRTRIEERLPRPVRAPPRVVGAVGSEHAFRGDVWQVAGADHKSPYRPTVSAAQVAYLDARQHRPVRFVDRAVAATRHPPHSVFVLEGALFMVPGDARPESGEVRLGVAPSGTLPNEPLLQSRPTWSSWIEEPAVVQRQSLRLALGSATMEVVESVAGLLPLGASRAEAIRISPVEARFESRGRVIFLEGVASPEALEHLRAVLQEVLPLFVTGAADDLAVAVLANGFGPVAGRPSVVIYDRYPRGVGLAEALDAEAVWLLLRWAREVVARCSCADGCAGCVPARALSKDKSGVLTALRSAHG